MTSCAKRRISLASSRFFSKSSFTSDLKTSRFNNPRHQFAIGFKVKTKLGKCPRKGNICVHFKGGQYLPDNIPPTPFATDGQTDKSLIVLSNMLKYAKNRFLITTNPTKNQYFSATCKQLAQ